jgi:hypothetical protein
MILPIGSLDDNEKRFCIIGLAADSKAIGLKICFYHPAPR